MSWSFVACWVKLGWRTERLGNDSGSCVAHDELNAANGEILGKGRLKQNSRSYAAALCWFWALAKSASRPFKAGRNTTLTGHLLE